MIDEKPLIGITGGRKTDERLGMLLYAIPSYAHAVEMAGGLPVLLPVTVNPAVLEAIYRRLDGLVLTGGGDVLPGAYGATGESHIYGADVLRDIAEVSLARWAVTDDKPLLAICRGCQVLNVALGGTLHRHIPDAIHSEIAHDHVFATHRSYLAHTVTLTPDSKLTTALGKAETNVNSLHHQAVAQHAEDLRIVARAPDGVIEGIEHPTRRFALGVQWHPEELVDTHPAMRRLFWAFMQAARGCDAWRDGSGD